MLSILGWCASIWNALSTFLGWNRDRANQRIGEIKQQNIDLVAQNAKLRKEEQIAVQGETDDDFINRAEEGRL
jgi:hypothetical protein